MKKILLGTGIILALGICSFNLMLGKQTAISPLTLNEAQAHVIYCTEMLDGEPIDTWSCWDFGDGCQCKNYYDGHHKVD